MSGTRQRLIVALSHASAASAALAFALLVFRSPYMQSSLQFVAPFLVVLLVHLVWTIAMGTGGDGWVQRVLIRAARTTTGLTVVVLVAAILWPMPGHAAINSQALEGIAVVIGCLLFIVLVMFLVALAAFVIIKILTLIGRSLFDPLDDEDKGASEVASLVIIVVLLGGASVEGLPWAYVFTSGNQSTASQYVAARPTTVWNSMQTATSPAFPLPEILKIFPQPVAVPVDEGTGLDANRIVLMRGREGEGRLHLRVVESDGRMARFAVLSDTSPFANWVGFRFLTYRLEPEGRGTRLDVTLDYDRLLAPAWAFTPLIRGAAHLAMDVLVRDTKRRAEAAATVQERWDEA